MIENELKFVLKPEIEKYLGDLPKWKILQAYLPSPKDIAYRIRKSICKDRGIFNRLTIKYRNEDGTNTEFEFPIHSENDFVKLLSKATQSLTKNRFLLKTEDHNWEIDVFHDNTSYFWMAEVELPVGQAKPASIPSLIGDHLVYEVLLTDSRFSSRKISNVAYARKLFTEVTENDKEKV